VSSSTQNQAFNALLFLFRDVLHRDLDNLQGTVRAKRSQKLPVVLSIEEVKTLFQQIHGKYLLFLHLIYGSGMRISEFVHLRVKDIDFQENSSALPGFVITFLVQRGSAPMALASGSLLPLGRVACNPSEPSPAA
jgi:site-specific recombinase XerD